MLHHKLIQYLCSIKRWGLTFNIQYYSFLSHRYMCACTSSFKCVFFNFLSIFHDSKMYIQREVTNVNTCALCIMNYTPLLMPLIHRNTRFSCNLFLGGRSRQGRGYFLYVWVYLSDKDTCQIRHISLCIHRGPYLTGNTVLSWSLVIA